MGLNLEFIQQLLKCDSVDSENKKEQISDMMVAQQINSITHRQSADQLYRSIYYRIIYK